MSATLVVKYFDVVEHAGTNRLLLARWRLRLSHLETTGGICGAMTSTPGLGAATSTTESSVPPASYATVYPVALVLITLVSPLLISLV